MFSICLYPQCFTLRVRKWGHWLLFFFWKFKSSNTMCIYHLYNSYFQICNFCSILANTFNFCSILANTFNFCSIFANTFYFYFLFEKQNIFELVERKSTAHSVLAYRYMYSPSDVYCLTDLAKISMYHTRQTVSLVRVGP